MNTAVNPLQVGVAGPIRQDPELNEAVRQATTFFDSLVEKYKLDPAERTLDWGCSDEPNSATVIAHLRETDRYGTRQANGLVTRQRLLDPVARDVMMMNLLQDVLRQRWYQLGKVIDRGIDELEREEPTDGHTD